MPRKTLILTIVIILVSAGAAGLLWYLVFGPLTAPAQPTGTTLPTELQGKIKQLSPTPTLWASISSSQNKIFWYDESGQLWSSGLDGSGAKATTQAPVQNFIKSAWSKDGSKNVMTLGTSQKDIRFVSLFSESAISTFLPNNTKTAAFSPDGKRIIYQVIDDSKNQNTLFGSDPDGKKAATVAVLRLRDVVVGWPQASLISFFSKTDQNAQNPRLSVMDLNGNAKDLGVSTAVGKCAWASNNRDVYCAAGHWPENAVLPDDYYKNAFSIVDDIGKINVDSGKKDIIISSVVDAVNLVVSQNQDFLIFITKNTGRLYRLGLK